MTNALEFESFGPNDQMTDDVVFGGGGLESQVPLEEFEEVLHRIEVRGTDGVEEKEEVEFLRQVLDRLAMIQFCVIEKEDDPFPPLLLDDLSHCVFQKVVNDFPVRFGSDLKALNSVEGHESQDFD